jgi:hypothetical protein
MANPGFDSLQRLSAVSGDSSASASTSTTAIVHDDSTAKPKTRSAFFSAYKKMKRAMGAGA